MQTRHVPRIDRRYWFGIILASVFGTNLGDYYAHHSGLGIGAGLLLLAGLFAISYAIEKKDGLAHEIYYWIAIIIVRTGATNIADYLAFRIRVPPLLLVSGLAAAIAGFAWVSTSKPADANNLTSLSRTNLSYWAAMLAAGTFGTVCGDIASHAFGQEYASIGLGVLLVLLLALARGRVAVQVSAYWCAVAVARTAGTCMGDWLAEDKLLALGLTWSTLLTGTAFLLLLMIWRSPRDGTAA